MGGYRGRRRQGRGAVDWDSGTDIYLYTTMDKMGN